MNTNMRIELFAEDAQREVYRASQAALYWQQQAGVR